MKQNMMTSLERTYAENQSVTLDKYLPIVSVLTKAENFVWGLDHSTVKAATYFMAGYISMGQFLA